MSKSTALLLICTLILITHISFPSVVATSPVGDHSLSWISAVGGADLDLEDDVEEFAMNSETTRRILATTRRYISYGALSKNNVPCSRRGASYYNCRSGGQANPYTRGCSAITRCRR